MHVPPLLSSNALLASAATGAVSALKQAAPGTVNVSPTLYALIALAIGFSGVWLARLVTTESENKRLGRKQTTRETLPLTLIGVLIVCPLIWHYQIAVPWASLLGLGVGYAVRIILRILGDSAVDAARALARRAVGALDDTPAPLPSAPPPPTVPPGKMLDAPGAQSPAVIMPPTNPLPGGADVMRRLDDMDDSPGGGV